MLQDLPSSSTLGNTNSGRTSSLLIVGLQAASPDAWRMLVAVYSPLIYRWCRRMGVARNEVADVCQEVFRAVLRKVGEFSHNQPGDSFCGWLHTITRNKVRDYLRDRRIQPQAVGGSEAQMQLVALAAIDAPDETSYDNFCPPADDKKLLIAQVLAQLRGEFGQSAFAAFWRMVVDGHSAAEIGCDLEMSPKAVRQAKYRVLHRLRQELRELE